PMLSALSTYRTQTRPSPYHGTVGWITNWPERNEWRAESFVLYRQGAVEALAQHGYRVEDFWLQEPGLTTRRAAQILQSRGIRGLLIAPLPVHFGHLSLPWEKFASITFGHTMTRPALHLVTTYHYQNMQMSLRHLHHLGYRRPGFVTWDALSKRVRHFWTAAYRMRPFATKREKDVPILQLDTDRGPDAFSPANRKVFLKWFETHRPDAILTVDRHIIDWLIGAGYRVPEDVAYVSPSLQPSNVEFSGVLEPSLEIGRTAGDFLVGMLNRGEYGIPKVPRRIFLEGQWQAGTTARRRSAAAAD
ncbi:MAG TPA: substrate-binding domain-containing protein, partial [Candidatus Methylacidiphilales bacterium]